MKFIFSHKGFEAVNVAFIKRIAVEHVIYKDSKNEEVHVTAELNDDSDVVLKIFDSENAEENLSAANAYLAELVDELNGGAK